MSWHSDRFTYLYFSRTHNCHCARTEQTRYGLTEYCRTWTRVSRDLEVEEQWFRKFYRKQSGHWISLFKTVNIFRRNCERMLFKQRSMLDLLDFLNSTPTILKHDPFWLQPGVGGLRPGITTQTLKDLCWISLISARQLGWIGSTKE